MGIYCFLFCKDTFSIGSQTFCRYINIFAVGIVVEFYSCSTIIVCFYIGCPVKCAPEILHGGKFAIVVHFENRWFVVSLEISISGSLFHLPFGGIVCVDEDGNVVP